MNPLEILTTVNAFYDQAFNRLLIITFGLIAFIGVIVPIAIGWLQLRTLRAEKGSLLNELRAEINAEREKVEEFIQSEVDKRIEIVKAQYDVKFEETAEKIRESSASALARTHHIQGHDSLTDNSGDFGIGDLCHAASLYFTGKEEDNARRCIVLITNQCLPKISSAKYIEHKIKDSCDGLVKSIKKNNQNSRYKDDLDELEHQMSLASSRSEKSPTKSA